MLIDIRQKPNRQIGRLEGLERIAWSSSGRISATIACRI
jgi:hypothetical protein